MDDNQDYSAQRRSKLGHLVTKGVLPYADKFECTHTLTDALAQPDGVQARVAGRLMSYRSFGKLAFAHLRDRSGRGQISFETKTLSEDTRWLLDHGIDIGDFLGISGTVWTTRTGERTLAVNTLTFLSKGLRSLPEKWHGLKDTEALYRQRYLDLLMNKETQEKFEIRSKVIRLIRHFLDANGFLEVETPILQAASSGAAARPFQTFHHALKADLFLRISPETYLKRLVVGGLERVYEIGKNFRNEGLDRSHLQEFTMLEWYAAYWNYQDNMKFIRELIQYVLQEICGTMAIEYQGAKLDFSGEWPVLDYREAIEQETGIDILAHRSHTTLAEAVRNRCPDLQITKYHSLPALMDALYKHTVRPKLIQPTFLVHHPTVLVPLARRNDQNPDILNMFQVVINSWEVVKAYSELIDPVDQRTRMEDQLRYREQGDEETMMMEEDYIECMEYGMPPISGLGLGIDRFVALLTNVESLRDTVFFPTMRIR